MWLAWLACAKPTTEALQAPAADPPPTLAAQIASADERLRAVIALDPDARPATDGGPLHGIPVLLKDNIDAVGFATTAGSFALADHRPADDAFLVARLRQAGAVVLGKVNLTEWANFRGHHSISGWSAVGGQTGNAVDPSRSPCGSSSGSAVAVAAGYAPLAVGTETDGSILCPASVNGIVGVKPTIGLVSRDGIVPIAPSQDTAGPMARTVREAALLLEVLAAADPADPATARRPADLDTRYTAALSPDALKGARIGVARGLEAFSPKVDRVFAAALAELEALGAELVDVEFSLPDTVGADEEEVLVHEFRPALEAYLATVDPALGVPTLPALIAFNEAHPDELRWFGQELFEQAADHPQEHADYAAAAARLRELGPKRIDTKLERNDLDAIVTPTTGPAWLIDPVNGDAYTGGTSTITAVTGYPAVTVPMGEVEHLPIGITFFGTAFDEARLLALAYAYEQRLTPAGP